MPSVSASCRRCGSSPIVAAALALGPLAVVVHNAGSNNPAPFLKVSQARFEGHWREHTLGGFHTAQASIPVFLEQGGGTLIFTGASASLRGRPGFGAFNAAKGALRLMAQALAKECGPEGLHVGHVVVDGGIDGEILRNRFPDFAAAAGERLIDLEGLAEAYWFLHQQAPRAWTFELDLRSKLESW